MNNCQSSKDVYTDVLRDVSRAFYLSMSVLPGPMRCPISLGYLLARAADTIADTHFWDKSRRIELLSSFRQWLGGAEDIQLAQIVAREVAQIHQPGFGITAGELTLLKRLPEVSVELGKLSAPDANNVRQVVDTLISGMLLDLETFPGSFVNAEQTEHYTYLVAGCVGKFWTAITRLHTGLWNTPGQANHLDELGVSFGKALQLTNILRDIPKDLQNQRCYLPISELGEHLGDPDELSLALSQRSVRVQLALWIERALTHFEDAVDYIRQLPWYCLRLRLAVIWPVVIGLGTLRKLAKSSSWPSFCKREKVSRYWVYKILVLSGPLSLHTPSLAAVLRHMMLETKQALKPWR